MKAFKPGLIEELREPVAPARKPAPLASVEQNAAEYLKLKIESERIENRLKGLRRVLEPELARQPDGKLFVEGFDRYLHLVECTKPVFDLAAAEKKKDIAKVIAPFIMVKRELDLKAALKHVGERILNPFIDANPYTTLRTPVRKETDE